MLFNHDVVADGNRVLAVGGGGNCFSFGTHFDAPLLAIDLPDEEFEDASDTSMIIPGR